MSRLTDKDLHAASANPDGKTYNGLTVMRWLFEATTGKEMSEDEAAKLFENAKALKGKK